MGAGAAAVMIGEALAGNSGRPREASIPQMEENGIIIRSFIHLLNDIRNIVVVLLKRAMKSRERIEYQEEKSFYVTYCRTSGRGYRTI